MKNMKSYVKAILGEETLEGFNDFEKGVIFMEKSRLDHSLPPRIDFLTALEFAKDGVENLKDYSTTCPNIVKQVGLLSIDLLNIQLEILDKYPKMTDWTYRKSLEITRSDEDLCNRLDFVAGKLYQLMPLYSEEIQKEVIKNYEKEKESREFIDGLKNIAEGEDTIN